MWSLLQRSAPACRAAARALRSNQLASRGLATAANTLAVGTKHHGFVVDKATTIDELKINLAELTHQKTGAKVLHFDRDDPNNVFAVGFRTPVTDSTGLPHILEHTTLCGSAKYPVRDPFFKMLQRSLSTYMNAWTAHDYTLYPFSTQNLADHRNLMNIYLDAVFHPKLTARDFSQEGWRLEHQDPKDPNSPLVFKGVVYNEMKGAMADIQSHFYFTLSQSLFPNSIYAPNSGGDPAVIPSLKYEDLVAFHRRYYRPENARFFVYGSAPIDPTLEHIDRVISSIERPPLTDADKAPVNDLPSLAEPKTVKATCALDPMGDPAKQTRMCIAWGCNDVHDVYTTAAMKVLSSLLLDGSSSPMQQALIDSGLAPDYSPVIGYDSSLRKASFGIGVQGISAEQIPVVEKTIWDVLNKVAETGFPKERIDAIVHQTELSLRHVTAQFGLGLLQGVSSGVFQGTDAVESLRVTAHMRRIHDEAVNGDLFQRLVRTYLLENQHRVTLIMEPDANLTANQATDEAARLAERVEVLTDADRKAIYERGLDLAAAQNSKEDLSVLPCLSLDEVPLETPYHAIERHERALPQASTTAGAPASAAQPVAYPLVTRTSETNGVTYLRLQTVLDLPKELLPLLPLFSSALTWQGTKDKTMEQLDQEIKLLTGGVSASPQALASLDELYSYRLGLGMGGSVLTRQAEHLARLMPELLFGTAFDRVDRLQTLVAGNVTSMANSIVSAGHRFARSLAVAQVTPMGAVSESWGGISQLRFLHALQSQNKVETVVPQLEAIRDRIALGSTRFMATAEPAAQTETMAHVDSIAREFAQHSSSNVTALAEIKGTQLLPATGSKIFVATPFPVHFCAAALPTVPFMSTSDSMALAVAGNLATHGYLHREVREKGGAYGAGANHAADLGVYSLFSYRDPHAHATLEHFTTSFRALVDGGIVTDQALHEAKLSLLGDMDMPLDAGAQGAGEFAQPMLTKAVRQARRDALRNVTREDVARVAETYLVGRPLAQVVLGPAASADAFMADGWEVVSLEL
ncbi:hypothetical protein AMAG_09031 [Allomyces macrogynus ATCC 38327]|uniref:Presequence protease, mitochondrial n=1 Tax=Allomyces macrogynus (strain ATCC 38327) TaxID=578462 RepID=A0A0L0SNM8_ALLM3|nr:hypothetical protein AMAG_09031 [Allomyces macrogynus ATCC 38327]|eukprot:KNE63969.1 hypothetical protein AMAG_09031 [Allomyces macrogynus ATCC 38327]